MSRPDVLEQPGELDRHPPRGLPHVLLILTLSLTLSFRNRRQRIHHGWIDHEAAHTPFPVDSSRHHAPTRGGGNFAGREILLQLGHLHLKLLAHLHELLNVRHLQTPALQRVEVNLVIPGRVRLPRAEDAVPA